MTTQCPHAGASCGQTREGRSTFPLPRPVGTVNTSHSQTVHHHSLIPRIVAGLPCNSPSRPPPVPKSPALRTPRRANTSSRMADLLTPQTRKSAAPVRSRPTTAAGARRMRPSLAPAPASLYAPLALPIAGGRAREGSDELLIRPVPLDFTPLFDKMDRFLVHFKAAVSSTCSRAEAEREEHETCLSLTRDEVRAVAAEVAEAKQIQSTLWETIRAQRVADAEERDTIAQLRAVQASLSSKSDDLRVQLAAVTKQTGRKRTHLEMVRDTIHLQRSKTPWEHQRLQDLLGIDIQPTRHSCMFSCSPLAFLLPAEY